MNKIIKMMLSFVCLISMISCIPQKNAAALEKLGSITIELEDGWDGTTKENVEFRVIQVGQIINGDYQLVDEFRDLDIDLNKIDTAEKLQENADLIAKKLEDRELESLIKKTDENGYVSFEKLKVGIYLIENTDRNNYDNISPTLIVIPTFVEESHYVNSMNYDVKVIPKHSPVIKVEFSKQDISTQKELEGAYLKVTDKETLEVIDEWISEKNPHMIKDLEVGKTYIMTEVIAPKGYKRAEAIEFTIDDTGNVQKIVMYDELNPTEVKTGDSHDSLLYIALFFGSLGLFVLIVNQFYRRKS